MNKTKNTFFNNCGFLVVNKLTNIRDLIEPAPKPSGKVLRYCPWSGKLLRDSEDDQVTNSAARYCYPKYKKYHTEIKFKLEKILGVKLSNTYYFDRFYFPGSELKEHVDRPSCEISVSLNISTNLNKKWPLYFKSGKSTIPVECSPGDSVIYSGTTVPHFRKEMPSRHNRIIKKLHSLSKKQDDTYYHQVFFHYVLSDGVYAHFANEGG